MTFNIPLWFCNKELDIILKELKILNKEDKYYINDINNLDISVGSEITYKNKIKRIYNDFKDSNNINNLKKYIHDLVLFHLNNINYVSDNYIIEFSLLKKTDKLIVEYDKIDKLTPIISILSFLCNNDEPILFTDVDIESYKYKEISDDKTFNILIPKKNCHLVFDGSKYYGICNINNNDKFLQDELYYLKINIYENKESINIDNIILSNSENYIYQYNPVLQEKEIFNINKKLVFENINELIIYNTNDKNTINILSEFFKDIDFKKYGMIFFESMKKQDNLFLINKYGNIVNDITSITNTTEIKDTNRFYNIKIFQKFLPIEVCYWIINESENYNNWNISNYDYFEKIINIESMPSILNYLTFSSYFWLSHFKKIYDIPDNLDIKIINYFVAKNDDKSVYNKNSNINDKDFFIFNVQLNDTKDFSGGDIFFENNIDNGVKLNQGDSIVYHFNKMRKTKKITMGEVYYLIIIVKLIL